MTAAETRASDFEHLLVEISDGVATITLNRPDALNALNRALIVELVGAIEQFDADEAIGAIVLTGSERAFAAGADISEMARADYAAQFVDDPFAPFARLDNVRTPLIAAVSGYALGGGCELAMMCDVILAADTAKFGQPEITLGTIPGIGGTQRLSRLVGAAKAAEMVLTGRRIDAEEAERAGLVSRVVPAAELLDEAAKVASTIAGMSRPVVYAAKQALRAARETTLAEGLRFERAAFTGTFALADRAEGIAAFLEKRQPNFTNR